MDAYRAYEVASNWGSYLYAGDPGACFYGFRFNDGRPATEHHRALCITHLDKDLLPLVGRVYGDKDRQELEELRAWFETAPLYTRH